MSFVQPSTVIDVHHHYIPHGESESLFERDRRDLDQESYRRAEIEQRRAAMARAGIAGAVVTPGHGYLRATGLLDTRRINDQITAYRRKNAELFPAALGVVEPQHGAAALGELDRIHGDLGLAGVSFHTRFQGVPTDSPAVITILKRMVTMGMTPFVHSGDSSEEALWRILNVARQVPEATIVVLDGLTGHEQTNQACLVAEVVDNLVFDTAGCPDFSFVARLIDRVGAGRLVFGSNTYSSVTPRKRSFFGSDSGTSRGRR